MNAHFRMIAFGVLIRCPPLLIFQKWIAASFKQQKYDLHGPLLGRLHQRGFVPDCFLIYDLSKHRCALAFRNDESNGSDIAGPCRVMQRGPSQFVLNVQTWPTSVDGFQHFQIGRLPVGGGVGQSAYKTQS